MPIISFITQKGGSGKSTLAINCAVAAMAQGKRVALLDMDAQGTADLWFRVREKTHGQTTPEVIRVEPGQISNVLSVAGEMAFDWLLIDTPGQATTWMREVIAVSDLCLVPCRPTSADVTAMSPTLDVLKQSGKPTAIVLSQAPVRSFRVTDAQSVLSETIEVCPVYISLRTAYQDAHTVGLGVTEYEAEGKAAEEVRELWKWITRKVKKAK